MDSLPNFGFLLKDVSRLYSRNFERHAARLDLTLHQCRVLGQVSRREGITQAQLAYLTETDPMTLSRLLARMEANGLLERRACPDDGRVRRLYLKAPVAPMLAKIWELSEVALAESLAGVTARERTSLMKVMSRIHANLDSLVPGMADRGSARQAGRRARPRTARKES